MREVAREARGQGGQFIASATQKETVHDQPSCFPSLPLCCGASSPATAKRRCCARHSWTAEARAEVLRGQDLARAPRDTLPNGSEYIGPDLSAGGGREKNNSNRPPRVVGRTTDSTRNNLMPVVITTKENVLTCVHECVLGGLSSFFLLARGSEKGGKTYCCVRRANKRALLDLY